MRQNSYPTAEKLSVRARLAKKRFEIISQCRKNSHSAKINSQRRKRVFQCLYTLTRTIAYTLLNVFAHLNTCNPYLNTCITYLNTLTRLPILIHSLPIFIHALPILIHWLGFRLLAPYLNTLNSSRQPINTENPRFSAANQNRAPEKPRLSATNQNRAPENPRLSATNQNRALRHPRALGYPGRPFLALSFSRLAIAYLNT